MSCVKRSQIRTLLQEIVENALRRHRGNSSSSVTSIEAMQARNADLYGDQVLHEASAIVVVFRFRTSMHFSSRVLSRVKQLYGLCLDPSCPQGKTLVVLGNSGKCILFFSSLSVLFSFFSDFATP